MTELSIVGLIGLAAETTAEAYAQFDRYTRLTVDVELDEVTGKRFTLSRSSNAVWLVATNVGLCRTFSSRPLYFKPNYINANLTKQAGSVAKVAKKANTDSFLPYIPAAALQWSSIAH